MENHDENNTCVCPTCGKTVAREGLEAHRKHHYRLYKELYGVEPSEHKDIINPPRSAVKQVRTLDEFAWKPVETETEKKKSKRRGGKKSWTSLNAPLSY